ncbi:VWA domain-containing protein [Acidipila sp. EB88]|uniref:VWA domain-containing protein n=1 Tax=Acidipila sp. EB88 TaxID=2305226 RepID=UPI0013154050|nr:VWA domain-containing protein [Acidipila sp. EB88]
MRPLFCAALLWALGPGCCVPAITAQDAGEQTLRVQVRLVSLYVNVTDAHGAPIADLAKNNFALSEDGVAQTISVFERQTNVPLSAVLAIDTSGSTRKDLGAEQQAAHDFAQALVAPPNAAQALPQPGMSGGAAAPGKDQLALFEFNSDVREVVPFTSSVRAIDGGIGRLSHGPATAFYSAVLLASEALANRPGRKVLILVSDGSNTVSGTTYDEALAAAQRSDTILYSLIDVPIAADAGRDTAGEHAMITLSQETGGRYFYVDQGGLAAALRKVSDDLRTQYLLAYYPQRGAKPADPLAGPSGFHTLHVNLQGIAPASGATAHYRSGYYRAAADR